MWVQSLKGHKSPYKSYWGGWPIDERVVWVNNRKNRKSRAYLMKKGENRLIIFCLPSPAWDTTVYSREFVHSMF